MSPNRISSQTSLMEMMRALARDRAKGAATTAHATPLTGALLANTSASTPRSLATLRQRLHTLLAQVDPNDQQAMAAAREPVLREVLLWEFGDAFRQDEQLQPIVDSIAQAMMVDARLQAQFVDMVRGVRTG